MIQYFQKIEPLTIIRFHDCFSRSDGAARWDSIRIIRRHGASMNAISCIGAEIPSVQHTIPHIYIRIYIYICTYTYIYTHMRYCVYIYIYMIDMSYEHTHVGIQMFHLAYSGKCFYTTSHIGSPLGQGISATQIDTVFMSRCQVGVEK